jgi:holliday junction DNA helicase RuvB
MLRRVRDFAQVTSASKVTRQVALDCLELLDIDGYGFDPMDRAILCAIIDKFDGGPVGVESLAATIGEERDTIEEVYEPYLLQEGFIARTAKGRIATARAYNHFSGPGRSTLASVISRATFPTCVRKNRVPLSAVQPAHKVRPDYAR